MWGQLYMRSMERLHVIYNDTCPICSREVDVYAREVKACDLPVDFSGLDTVARTETGLTREEAAKRFHVIADGKLLSGVDAFIALWRALPRWRWLARLIDLPVIRPIAKAVYDHLLAPLLFGMDQRRQRRSKTG